jgi:hypothetical protein
MGPQSRPGLKDGKNILIFGEGPGGGGIWLQFLRRRVAGQYTDGAVPAPKLIL